MALCPTCKKKVAPLADNPGFPFCTTQCKAVDLGRWLNEDFRIAAVEGDDSSSLEDGTPKDLS